MVDGNRADCNVVATLLGEKYQLLFAPDAEKGSALYLAERPDCVLLEQNLPDVGGLDALADFVNEGAVVVMLTAGGSHACAAEALKRGARDYVLKSGLNPSMLDRILTRELERRRLELDLLAAQAELRIAQRLEAIGQLATGIAHEINTPAQYVSDNIAFLGESFDRLLPLLNVLEEDLAEFAGNGTREELQRMAKAADIGFLLAEIPAAIKEAATGMGHIKKVVAAMKETSHPGNTVQPVDINRAVVNAVTLARSEWKYVAEVAFDLDSELPHVECYRSEIQQVVMNLLVNAAHAIGEVTKGKGTKGVIGIRTRRDTDYAVIEVEDSGGGIPEPMVDKIFDLFFTTKEPGKGTGQGLAIVHRIVVQHHRGTVRVASHLGEGSTFTVRLPIARHSN